MTNRTVTLLATNSAGTTPASVTVTVADPPGTGNVIELVGTNTMANVDPDPTRQAVYAGNLGLGGIFADSGMTYCPWYGPFGALVVTGGGHADYHGNEVYVFPFVDAIGNGTWIRLTNPSTAGIAKLQVTGNTAPAGYDPIHGEHSDGTPLANHNYSNLATIPGGNKGLLLQYTKNHICWTGLECCNWSHVCDLETGVWSRFSTNATPHRYDGVAADAVCYDATRNRIWGVNRGGGGIITYLDLATKAHSAVLGTATNGGYIPTCARVAVNDLMICATNNYGNFDQPMPFVLYAINLASPGSGQKFLPMVGDLPPDCVYPANGFDWDTAHNCGYLYVGNWGWGTQTTNDNLHVYRISPPGAIGENWLDGRPWTFLKITLPSAFPKQLNGVYSRWRYCSGIGKFALVSNINNKVALWTPPS